MGRWNRQTIVVRFVLLLGCAFWPLAADAQSAIAGVVRDASGGVLPGVTIEAASPSLIGGVRTASTDDQGRYTIADLRPGVYAVTFSLAGFTSVKREGIELAASFTAPLNVELRVGDLQETITVTGESPIVDVQNVVRQNVMTRQMLDALPTGRNIQAIAVTTPGVTISRPDVGGSEGMQHTFNTVHGSNTRDYTVAIDGMGVTSSLGDGSNLAVYHNEGAYDEVSYQTSGISAEVSSGGIRVNLIPKEGGNRFSLFGFASYADGAWQGNNFTQGLKDRGVRAVPRVDRMFDYNASFGGPLKESKLWFFTSGRYWGVDQFAPDSFKEDGSQGVDDNLVKSAIGRLTYQANQKNKISIAFDHMPKWRGHREIAAGIEPRATVLQYTPWSHVAQAKWSSPITSRLLAESGFSAVRYNYWLKYQPEVQPTDIARVDLVLGTRRVAALQQFNNWFAMYRWVSAVSYVTGTHNVKMGVQYGFGPNEQILTVNGDLVQRYSNGVPNSVQVRNTPVHQHTQIKADLGLYIQDTWTVDRLTLNYGLRFDYFNSQVDAQSAGAGRFAPARSFDAITDLPNWKDIAPRIGAAFDVFGDGRTAVKVSVNKYLQNEATGFAGTYNPMIADSDIRTWTDLNRDDIAQDNEIGPSQNANFGIRASRFPADDIKRPYQMEYTALLQRQIGAGFSVQGGYFRRGFHRLISSTNTLISPADFTLVTVPNPLGGTIPVYNLNPAKLGQVSTIDSNSEKNSRTYNGYELSFNARIAGKATIIGGTTFGRTIANLCDVKDDPNRLLYCDQSQYDIPFAAQYKFSAAYTLPWSLQASAVFQSYAGDTRVPTDRSLRVNYFVNRAIVPNLTQSQVQVSLVAPGSKQLPRWSQMDVRLGRIWKFKGASLATNLEAFNVLNSDDVFGVNQSYGVALDRPTDIIMGRVIRISTNLKF